MARHLEVEIDRLKRSILSMAGLVEDLVLQAVQALLRRDRAMARRVADSDTRVDQMEVEIEEECLKVLALHQPVATDLRFIISVLKINNDLERIADLAVNIAERASTLASHDPIDIPFALEEMGEKASTMLKMSLDSLVNQDTDLARAVRDLDDEVDAINRDAYEKVESGIQRHLDRMQRLINLLSAARHLERIADLATNIAEDVIYMVEGEIVRHRHDLIISSASRRD